MHVAVLCNEHGCMNGSSSFTWRLICSGSWSVNLGIGVILQDLPNEHGSTVSFGMFRSTSWKGKMR